MFEEVKNRSTNRLVWDEEANKNQAFQKIKQKIKKCSRLAFPIYNSPECQFTLATDASKNAETAVLKHNEGWILKDHFICI